jgi:hypothetical protein
MAWCSFDEPNCVAICRVFESSGPEDAIVDWLPTKMVYNVRKSIDNCGKPTEKPAAIRCAYAVHAESADVRDVGSLPWQSNRLEMVNRSLRGCDVLVGGLLSDPPPLCPSRHVVPGIRTIWELEAAVLSDDVRTVNVVLQRVCVARPRALVFQYFRPASRLAIPVAVGLLHHEPLIG